jgi:hypothetical protein
MFELNRQWVINGSPRWNVARYLNHSCRPNAKAVVRKGRIVFVASRAIEPGEEITYNYGREYFDYFLKSSGCRCTVWTRSWAVKQQFAKQSDQENKIYYEPRCIEGNYGLPGLLRGARMEERAFAEGRGPDPATKDFLAPLVDTAEDAFHLQDPLFQ